MNIFQKLGFDSKFNRAVKEYDKMLDESIEKFTPDSLEPSDISVSGTFMSRKFKSNGISYTFEAVYFSDIKSVEIRFRNLNMQSYKKTGDTVGFSASKIFGAMMGITETVFKEIQSKKTLVPDHVFFTSEDSERTSLYDRISKHKTLIGLMNQFGYVRDDKYSQVIKKYIIKNMCSDDIAKNDYKDYKTDLKVYCYTRSL